MLWIYTENDGYFAPSIARAMYLTVRDDGEGAPFVDF